MDLFKRLKPYIKPITNEESDFWYDKILSQEKVYKLGTASKFVAHGFSTAKVLDRLNLTEVSHTVAPQYNFQRDVLGCSNFPTKRFLLSPYLKKWKVTMFHELGHLFYQHEPTIFDRWFNPTRISRIEVEAETFSYLCIKKLNLRQPINIVGFALAQYAENDVILTQDWFDEIDKKSDEFLKLGA